MKNNKLFCTSTIFNKKAWWIHTLFLILFVSLFHPLANLQVQAAEGGIPINDTYFPDVNFQQYLSSQTYGSDGILSAEEIQKVTRMDVVDINIVSLKGIEYFTSLTTLNCYNNQLTSLDLIQNTELTFLDCYNNQLTSLDLSQNTELTTLHCGYNQLTSLDIGQNKELTTLNCYNNQLTSLDLIQNTELTFLNCYNNQLTSLDLIQNTELTFLDCFDNQLTSLDIGQNTELTNLNCGGNQLTSLDLSQNMELTNLNCFDNQLTSLDIIKHTELTFLNCCYNQLTSLDIDQNTELTSLDCDGNQLTSLDIGQHTELTFLHCASNQLTSLDLSQNTELTFLNCFDNQLTSLDIGQNTELTFLDCGGNQLMSLDLIKNTKLTTLYCDGNQLTSLDIGQNTELTTLSCHNNQYVQNTDAKNQIDVADLPDNFDMDKAKSWNGAVKDENNFITATAGRITYTYECGNNYSVTFTLIPAFPVSYQLNGGMNHQDNPVKYTSADNLILQAPTRSGYTFAGWYSDASFKKKVTSIGNGSIGSQTIYAKWTPNQYTLKFNVGKGKVSLKTKKVTYDTQYGSLAIPKRAGYSFQGWYTKNSGGSKITSGKKVTIAKDQTLYARWKKVSVRKASIRRIKNRSSKKAVLTFKKVRGASGYQVVYANNKKFKKLKKINVSKTKVTLKKLTKGKSWHIKVRAYKKDSAGKKVYGKYSSVKHIKIKK